MAWVSYERVLRGTEVTGKWGESLRVPETWQIRVDSPTTTKSSILAGVTATIGVTWGSAHPEFSSLKAMEFHLRPDTDDGMRWLLTVTYYVPPTVPQSSGLPTDVWERIGGTSLIPVFRDKAGAVICNAAGDAIDGLEKEREDVTWGLTKAYATDSDFGSAVGSYAGKVNSTTWSTYGAKSVKCYLRSAKRVYASKLDNAANASTLAYIESQWEFIYDPDLWVLKPPDVGLQELVSGTRKAIMDGGTPARPVRQPVALNSNGTKKADGSTPSAINSGAGVEIYNTADWSSHFGIPYFVTPPT